MRDDQETFESYADRNGFELVILSRPIGARSSAEAIKQYRQGGSGSGDPFMDLWYVSLSCRGITIESKYSKGIGLRENRKGDRFPFYWGKRLTVSEAERLLTFKPIDPTAGELLSCFYLDASGIDQAFGDWAGDLGYDPDSIKALGIFNTCQEIAAKLRSMIGRDFADKLSELEDL